MGSSPQWMNGRVEAKADMTGRAYNRRGRALSSRCDLGPILARSRPRARGVGGPLLRLYVAAGRARRRGARRRTSEGAPGAIRRVRARPAIILASLLVA